MMENMITVNKKQITVIIPHQNKIYIAGSRSCGENDFSEALLPNHRNQKINLLLRNHRNQFTKGTRGQSITEYTVFITVVVMALLAMQVYLKRGVQGKIKDMADYISPTLYNPNTTTSEYNVSTGRIYTSVYSLGAANTTVTLDQTNRTGYDYVEPEAVY